MSSNAPTPFYRRFIGVALLSLTLLANACSGGGGGGKPPANGNGGPPGSKPPNNSSLTPWAISDAGNIGRAANLLEAGDSFLAEAEVALAESLWDSIWGVLASKRQWTGSNPLNTYQFGVDTDPLTNWGRAYRYTGFDTIAGPIRIPAATGGIVGSGTYQRVDGRRYEAMILQTWDNSYWQIVIMVDANTFVTANQHFNGYPVLDTFTGS